MKNHQRRHRCLWPPHAYVPVCTHVVATHTKYTKQNKVFRASLLCRNPRVHPKLHYKESDIPGEDEVTTSGDVLSNLNPKWGKKRQAGTWEHNSIPLKILSSQKSWDSLKSSRPKKRSLPLTCKWPEAQCVLRSTMYSDTVSSLHMHTPTQALQLLSNLKGWK